jgi:hypothetical protein
VEFNRNIEMIIIGRIAQEKFGWRKSDSGAGGESC